MIPESVLSTASGWENQPVSNSRPHRGRRGTNDACKKNRREKRQIKILLGRIPGLPEEKKNPGVRDRIFGAMQRLPLPEWGPVEHRRRPLPEEIGE